MLYICIYDIDSTDRIGLSPDVMDDGWLKKAITQNAAVFGVNPLLWRMVCLSSGSSNSEN